MWDGDGRERMEEFVIERVETEVGREVLGSLSEMIDDGFCERVREDGWIEKDLECVDNSIEKDGWNFAQENTYVNPVGYASETDEEDEQDDELLSAEEEEDAGENGDEIETTAAGVLIQPNEVGEQGSFMVGMTFANAKEAREAINLYGVKFGYKLKFEKNEPGRLRVFCMNDSKCPFKLLVSADGDNGGLAIKTLLPRHSCFKQKEVPSVSQSFLAKYFKENIYKNPKFTVKDMQHEIKKHLKLDVSEFKCKRAKHLILTQLQGSFKQEFSMLGAYVEMVKKSNPGSKCELQLSEDGLEFGKRVFKRLFVMFDACRRNWMEGCRPIISLDGCFLKGVTHGMLLTAVGLDGNDQIVPIAWAVVSKENKLNWRWFLCWLRQELELEEGANTTIISDMQKGLLDAVNVTLPKAEHRWCARHIYANWSKKWKGDELMKKFWICAWSTYEEEFRANLTKLGEIKKQAAQDLLKYPVQTWCRAYQSNRCNSLMVDNNISESFNSSLLGARYKPIITMLEEIRILVMTRIKDRKKLCDSWIGEWSPAAMNIYQEGQEAAAGCRVLWNGAQGYEIGEGEYKHTILLDKMLCTCRVWELTGIPCAHAIAAFHYSKIDPLSKMSNWYHKSTYQKAYECPILPVPGVKFYKIEDHAPVEPPPITKMTGRPRKKRIRASNEPSSVNHLSRRGQIQRCSICKAIGHKKNACPSSQSQVSVNSQVSTTSRPKKIIPRRQSKASKQFSGIGVYVSNNGRTTYNPGMSSERVIVEDGQSTQHDSDPMIRFPIPNERVINQTKRKLKHVSFAAGEGLEVRQPGALPFKPPGLKWNGATALTTSQLLDKREKRRLSQGKHGDQTDSTSASTTAN